MTTHRETTTYDQAGGGVAAMPEARVQAYQVTVQEAADIARRGRPLTAEELAARGPVMDVPASKYFREIAPSRNRPFDAAALTGEKPVGVRLPAGAQMLVFPAILEAPPVCFCFSLVWEFQQLASGETVLTLRCEYLCPMLAAT